MATTVTEVVEAQQYTTSLIQGDACTRCFIVVPDSTDWATYGRPELSVTHPDVPSRGDAHPNRAGLIAQTVQAATIPNSKYATMVTVLYTSPIGRTSPIEFIRRRWSIGSREVEMLVDLDGHIIGSPYYTRVRRLTLEGQDEASSTYKTLLNQWGLPSRKRDESALVGTSVLVPEITLSLSMPSSYQFDAGLAVALHGHCNANDFEGAPPGACQYLGSDAEQIGPNGEYQTTHQFRMGQVRYYDRAGHLVRVINLDQDFWHLWREDEGGRVIEDNTAYIHQALRRLGNPINDNNPQVYRKYPRADLTALYGGYS